jgi:acetylornithine deacetylase/succinyl-diaminopimelate desuccinylase-like protein
MTDHSNMAIKYARSHKESYLDNLFQILKIPSVSTDPEHLQDMASAAKWIAGQLTTLGFKNVQIFPTARHPVVFGELLISQKLPTVLIYGHYDVQPAEPLELWQSPPFDPQERDDNLYARGASDMKGQVVATLSAVNAILINGGSPVNFKYLVEGEEEIGSPSLPAFLESHKELLNCSFALNPDAGMIAPDLPTIVYALRGLAYFEVKVYGPQHDLHSGLYGGVVHNPAIVLSDLISGMHDSHGRIMLPGFYDKVIALSDEERLELSHLPMDETYYKKITGVSALWGEEGFTPMERVGARPTLDVNGLYSGFTGPGSKTVIPAWAMAKISMRLVPNQDPVEVHRQLRQYLTEHAPKTVTWELLVHASGEACLTDVNHPAVKALALAQEAVWHRKPLYRREGGSIPVVADMRKILGVESVLTGFGLPDDNLHAPNEKLHLPTWYRGIEALIHFFYNVADGDLTKGQA